MGGRSGMVKLRVVGARGFEPPTSASRTPRANQAALRPVSIIIDGFNFFGNNPVCQRKSRLDFIMRIYAIAQ
jgi:hypothetical protein